LAQLSNFESAYFIEPTVGIRKNRIVKF